MMKMYRWILYTIVVLLSVSCKKFLQVTPRTELPEKVTYSTEEGFKKVLTGVYIQMKDTSLYGKELVFGTMEHLVSSWDVRQGSAEAGMNRHDYTAQDVVAKFDTIYAHMYAAVANLNALLRNIDERRGAFSSEMMYRLIKGEALGLRAFLHLDLLRIYGPVPSRENASPILSYVKTVSKEVHPKVDFKTFIGELLGDLETAEELLRDIDPITKYSLLQLRNPAQSTSFDPADDFYSHRMLRMNVYAVKALMARTYLWEGDERKACAIAKELVNVKDVDGTAKFRLGTDVDLGKNDFALINEHLFGLFDHNLERKFDKYFASGSLKKGNSPNAVTTQLYGNIMEDIRNNRLWEMRILSNTERINVLKKYNVQEYGGKEGNGTIRDEVELKQIPLIRISEMYLLLAEAGEENEAQLYWSRYLSSRGLPNRPLPQGTPARRDEIMKEFRREFFGEGQAFYTYKRMEAMANKIIFKSPSSAVEYKIPEPLKETEYIKRIYGDEESN
ncbi:RagB/SusD family nutrient uptake outer membrane protein [Sphingobacterium paucimobilis]|nr:RagB/SusD family nutrient uptake outer membrane protein [Sphingobacterium paucimobilis]